MDPREADAVLRQRPDLVKDPILGPVIQSTYQRHYTDTINALIQANPNLRKNPMTVAGLATQYGKTPNQVATDFELARIHAATRRSILGNIGHFLTDSYNSANDAVNNSLRMFYDPNYSWHQLHTFTEAAGRSIWNTGAAAVNLAGKYFTPGGQRAQTEAYKLDRANHPGNVFGYSLWRPVRDLGHALGTIAQLPLNFAGYEMSILRREGVAAALGDMFPGAVIGMMTEGALNPAIGRTLTGIEGAETDAAIVQNAFNNAIRRDRATIDAIKQWGEVSAEDMANLSRLNMRLQILDEQAVKREVIERLANSKNPWDRDLGRRMAKDEGHVLGSIDYDIPTKTIRSGKEIPVTSERIAGYTEHLGKILRASYNAVRNTNMFIGRPGMQAMYGVTAAIASQTDPDLWDQTQLTDLPISRPRVQYRKSNNTL